MCRAVGWGIMGSSAFILVRWRLCRGLCTSCFPQKESTLSASDLSELTSLSAPSESELEWAVRIVIGDAKADQAGRGAWTLQGKMIDVPVVGKAKATVKRAELCGLDVAAVKEKWKGQEPE